MSGITSTPIYTLFTGADFAPSETVFPPIGILPAELLIEIFSHCVANEPTTPLTLRQVSWWWKNLVDSSPRLWQTIILDNADSNTRFSEHQVALWTERSKPLKYDVELNVDDPDYILPLLSPLLSSINRWRALRLSGKHDEEIVMASLELTPDSLTHLHLCLHDFDQDDFDDEEPRITFSPISPGECTNFALNIWISHLPSPILLPPLRFVHLTIAEGGQIGLHTQPKYILEFLTSCSELESFYLSGWPHDSPVIGPLPAVHLPTLVTLHLKSTCFARAILSQYHEDGDSEDEARDYSQSPWSDQATGMGLRKLINRCNPPIRVLEMDFCDMRTKDFRYVFDRLPMLEDFYIVASDMSDKVINLLRPIFPNQSDRVVQLRLPRLRKLRLANCQRLNGTTIVEALTGRAQWTDAHHPEDTLVEVVVSGCERFSQWDRHLLSTVLQNRLRP
ncbi:hypothetical protein NLJ89_g7402 [Agrocybe chaxingu]|uniref:F-box domain-containing protein n=1 Tax=Agrocybe chaxingu TaxID=84603 RepID=A0A9W8MTQ9_9AGAR|nr:hypothetical protein NLJ89_g7402 [Agrocybe chaxingu]